MRSTARSILSPAAPRAPRSRRGDRAFTVLEVMLAVVLGSMVLLTALGVFAALQRSHRRNEDRLKNAMELSMTHRAAEMAFRSMVLSTSRPPSPADPLPTGQPAPASPSPESPEDETRDFERPRVILSGDDSLPPMRWIDSDGRSVQLEPQRLEITIERPPVFPEPPPGQNFRPIVRRVYASRHQRDRDNRREERRAERAEIGDDDAASSVDETEPAIAAGVRGAFGLTWEPDRPRPGDAPNPDGGSWSLWWRTLPPIVTIPDVDAEMTEGLSEDEIDSNPMYRPVRLAANLRWCKWEAVRAGETLSQFTSTWWEDLPAYMTLEIQTVSGKWSKWMFEVQGTRGAEPGTATGGTPETPPVAPEDAAGTEELGGSSDSRLERSVSRPSTGRSGR